MLQAEGGYVDHPNDPGGATKFGISSRSYPGEDIANMSIDRAKEIFKNDYYNKVQGDVLMQVDPGLAAHVSDMAFNAGPGTAVKLLYDAAGLPRQGKVTPELLGALQGRESLVADYTQARMEYYSGLGNAPTFLKGWTNRVNNLNKALEEKFGQVIQYDSSAAPGKVRNATRVVPNKMTKEDAALVADIAKAGNSTYLRNSENTQKGLEKYQQKATFMEAVGAYYDADQYNYTTQINRMKKGLRSDLAAEAEKALGGKMSGQDFNILIDAIRSTGMDDEKRATIFQTLERNNPDVNLSKFNDDEFMRRFNKKYEEDSRKFEEMNTGDWFQSPDGFMKKMGLMLGGYLPATIANIVQDPAALAVNLVSVAALPASGGVAIAAALGKAALKVGAADYIQNLYANQGLKGSVAEKGQGEMLMRAAGAGLGFAALAGLGHGVNKLWRSSSKKTAAVMDDIANSADMLEKVAAPEAREALRTMSRTSKLYKEQYSKNPFGTSLAAKQKLDLAIASAYKDLLNGNPIRGMVEPPSRLAKTDARPFKIAARTSEFPEVARLHDNAVKSWDNFKKDYVVFQEIGEITESTSSFVPVLNKNEVPFTFPTREAAKEFLTSPNGLKLAQEEKVKIVNNPEADGVFLAKSSAVEPVSSPSSAIKSANPDEIDILPGKALTTEGIEDLNKLYSHPTKSNVKPFQQGEVDRFAKAIEETPAEKPMSYSEYYDEIEAIRKREGAIYSRDAVKMADKEINIEAGLDPDGKVDVGEGKDLVTMTKKELLQELNEEKSLVKEFADCISGGSTNG